MVKTKQRQKNNLSHLSGSSNSVDDFDMLGEDSWVVVKKQIVTILVPSIATVPKSSTSNTGQSQLQPTTKEISNVESGPREATRLQAPTGMLPSTSKNIKQQSLKPAPVHCNLTLNEPLKQAIKPQNLDKAFNSRPCKVLGLSNSAKSMKQPRQLHCPGGFLSGSTLLNQRLRALNLERKLQKAGGLSNWLESLGLDQFVGIFQRRSVSKFQLVNMTMKKLKDMGADAVGPRRKLIHAIECVCN